ncbi:hypothetical protein QBC42DRAFT_260054 [Cladorrhinum samala]|uniref:Uncharacterized protein n=1 Tax=Cladorrhinum samala TaxID=585594 RepID=A0AAV9I296_9PEZI|nr:hypothetical protein QBC42DRAFT_260054 [Cladorrhinum samala]
MSQLNRSISKPRDPPPSLFLHPSPGASHVSLAGPGAASQSQSQLAGSGAPGGIQSLGVGIGILNQPQSQSQSRPSSSAFLRSPPDVTAANQFTSPGASSLLSSITSPGNAGPGSLNTTPGLGSISSPLRGGLHISNLPISLPRQESTRATDKTDARWARMQLTLEEVEFSASEGTRVFGPDHEKKLDELRAAQIALAQAWARSEADEAIETVRLDGQTGIGASSAGPAGPGEGTAVGATAEGGKSTVGSGSIPPTTRPGSSGLGITGTGAGIGQDGNMYGPGAAEQETEGRILLARKRREANDRYFQRVNQGVLDVVAKLEEVAVAMRAVEAESKEVWDDGGDEEDRASVPESSKT